MHSEALGGVFSSCILGLRGTELGSQGLGCGVEPLWDHAAVVALGILGRDHGHRLPSCCLNSGRVGHLPPVCRLDTPSLHLTFLPPADPGVAALPASYETGSDRHSKNQAMILFERNQEERRETSQGRAGREGVTVALLWASLRAWAGLMERSTAQWGCSTEACPHADWFPSRPVRDPFPPLSWLLEVCCHPWCSLAGGSTALASACIFTGTLLRTPVVEAQGPP